MKNLILVTIIVLIACSCGFAGTDLPKTNASLRAEEVLELLNKADKDQAKEYIENNFSPEFRDAFPMTMHLGLFTTTNSMFGELEVFDIIESSETTITLLLKSVTRDAFLKIELNVEPDEPYRIFSMGLAPAERPEGYKPKEQKNDTTKKGTDNKSKPDHPETINWDKIDKMLTRKTDSNKFSGTVLIAKDGQPLFQKAYGYASKEFRIKNNMETKFNLGSINKLFTSIGVMQLMEQGEIYIDDPLGKYLDYFPEEIAEKVTIRHLLLMKAGWGDYWDNEYFLAHQFELRKLPEYMEFIKDIPLDFEPGSNFQHCNTCFEVLGAIIESVTGMDYYDYIRENIYKPVGMSNSGSFSRDSVVENMAIGYTNMNMSNSGGESYRWNNNYTLSMQGTPAGGGYSTVSDFLKFDQAFRNYKLLNQDYTNFVVSQYKGSPGDEFYPPNRMSMAMGGAPGIGAFYGRNLTNGITILIFSNYDFNVAMETSKEVRTMMGIQ